MVLVVFDGNSVEAKQLVEALAELQRQRALAELIDVDRLRQAGTAKDPEEVLQVLAGFDQARRQGDTQLVDAFGHIVIDVVTVAAAKAA